MLKYDPNAELAPRDIVARSIANEILKSDQEYVYLDCRNINKQDFINQFPTILKNCKKIDLNPLINLIPVIPAAHYFCGGIKVNPFGETILKGLYAIGECSYTGLHGANRLASNSLLESLVFSHRAALNSLKEINGNLPSKEFYENVPEWNGAQYIYDEKISATEKLKKDLQKIMASKVGIFKTSEGLIKAESELKEIFLKTKDIYNENKLTLEVCELRNMVSVAYLMIKQSQELKENIGVFYNHDNVA
jgi:L-aspartate oxidase